MANLNQPPATPRDNINNPARNTTVNDLDDELTTKSSTMVTGLFRDRESAERAFQTVADRGYGKDDVNLIMSDDTRSTHFADRGDEKIGNHAAEGAGIGGLIGGTVGAIAGAIAAIGTSLIIPGLGIVIAGPLAAGLAGAGAGGITGGLAGALIGWGIPEERAKEYESGIKNGGILMGVTPRNAEDAAYFEEEWKKLRGEQVYR